MARVDQKTDERKTDGAHRHPRCLFSSSVGPLLGHMTSSYLSGGHFPLDGVSFHRRTLGHLGGGVQHRPLGSNLRRVGGSGGRGGGRRRRSHQQQWRRRPGLQPRTLPAGLPGTVGPCPWGFQGPSALAPGVSRDRRPWPLGLFRDRRPLPLGLPGTVGARAAMNPRLGLQSPAAAPAPSAYSCPLPLSVDTPGASRTCPPTSAAVALSLASRASMRAATSPSTDPSTPSSRDRSSAQVASSAATF